jgi:cytochrome P450
MMTVEIPAEVANAVVDPKAYALEKPLDEAFKWLRENAPLARIKPDGYNPFWAVTRHADIQAVEAQNDLFLSGVRTPAVCDARREANAQEVPVRTLVQMDNPDHQAYRRLTQEWFMPANLRKLQERIREVAKEVVDRMAATGGACDFVNDVALLYPLRVIMEILGVPEEHERKMLQLTQEVFAEGDPDLGREGEGGDSTGAMEAILEFVGYFNEMTEDRRQRPRGDLASAIANGRIDGQPIGELEAMGYYLIVATAGHDTTSHSVAGGLLALAENPALLARLKADPSLVGKFVEESIRWVTPVKHFMRTAAEDTELKGQKIARGDWLMLCYRSGTRDEAAIENPYEFDIERKQNKHVAFGFGPHVCLGQHLARMEMRLFWEELLPRLESVAVAGEVTGVEGNFVTGPKSIPIRFEMT